MDSGSSCKRMPSCKWPIHCLNQCGLFSSFGPLWWWSFQANWIFWYTLIIIITLIVTSSWGFSGTIYKLFTIFRSKNDNKNSEITIYDGILLNSRAYEGNVCLNSVSFRARLKDANWGTLPKFIMQVIPCVGPSVGKCALAYSRSV